MPPKFRRDVQYLGVVPAAIVALAVIDALSFHIPNQPGVLLLAVVYCAYRGGVTIGLAGSAIHALYAVYFFSDGHNFLHFSDQNLERTLVIVLVAPGMAVLVGLLRRESDRRLAAQQTSEAALAQANSELESRVATRTAELVGALDMAEQASAAKSMFLANMSHELRTPLNAIIGFSELMGAELMGPLGNDTYRGYVEDIHSSGMHLLAIITDILDLSKAESGKLELTESWVDAGELAAAVCRLVGGRAAQAQLDLAVDLPHGAVRLYADARLLKQALINLMINAIKFTAAGGRVELTIAAEASGVALVVKDTGIGIPQAHLDRVLQPFVQVDDSLSRCHQGTGLGLPLVKSIAELHGGKLRLASTEGVGTVATVMLPLDRLERSRPGIQEGCVAVA